MISCSGSQSSEPGLAIIGRFGLTLIDSIQGAGLTIIANEPTMIATGSL